MSRSTTALAAACAAATLALAPRPLAAQDRSGTVEITPFGGAHFGGKLYAGGSSAFSDDVSVKNAGTFGLRAAYHANEWLAIEAGFSTARSDIETAHATALAGSGVKVGRLDEEHYELNAVFDLARWRVVPYLALGAGATRRDVKADGAPDDARTRFTVNFGAGVKAFVSPNVALRAEWRSRAARGDATGCDPASPWCDASSTRYDDHWYYRWYASSEITGGVSVLF